MTSPLPSIQAPSTTAILQELQDRIQKATWGEEPAFDRVEIFDLIDFNKAAARLVMNQTRTCILVYAGEEYSTENRGQDLHIRLTHRVACLISDKVIADRMAAQMGGPKNPGTFLLQRLVVAAVAGRLLPNPAGATCVPTGSESLVIQLETEQPGRACQELDLEITGGEIVVNKGATPIR